MSLYKTKSEVLQEMLDDYKEITGETLTAKDLGYEEVIKMHTVAGAISSFYADLSKAYNGIHPQDSGLDDLLSHLESRDLPERIEAQKSSGKILITGTEGILIPVGTRVSRKSNGNLFESVEAASIDSEGEAEITFQSVSKGQQFNIEDTGIDFELVEAIADVDTACTSTTSFSNGRNIETPASILERIRLHDSRENSGGNIPAYEDWAKEASTQVVTAKSYRHVRGIGTVDTVITAGTSDIDTAIENGVDVLRIPSNDLVTTVQNYIVEKNPTTDNHQTFAPEEENFDTTIYYELFDETQRATVDARITKIWKKYIYKVSPSSRIYPTDLEKLIDADLSSLVKHRRVSNFSEDYYYEVPDRTLLVPNDLTLNGPA